MEDKYVVLEYKDTDSSYLGLHPTNYVTAIEYDRNNLIAPNVVHPHINISANNIGDALSEIEERMAQCGRVYNDLTFGEGKDIDILDDAYHQIDLESYALRNIIYFDNMYIMLLSSTSFGRSVFLMSRNGITGWTKVGELSNYVFVDMKCNNLAFFCLGYPTNKALGCVISESSEIPPYFSHTTLKERFYSTAIDKMMLDVDNYSVCAFDGITKLHVFKSGKDISSSATHQVIDFNLSDTPPNKANIININPGQYIFYYWRNYGSANDLRLITIPSDSGAIMNVGVSNLRRPQYISNITNDNYATNCYYAIANDKCCYLQITNPTNLNFIDDGSDFQRANKLLLQRCCNTYVLIDVMYTYYCNGVVSNISSYSDLFNNEEQCYKQSNLNYGSPTLVKSISSAFEDSSFSCKLNDIIYFYGGYQGGRQLRYIKTRI